MKNFNKKRFIVMVFCTVFALISGLTGVEAMIQKTKRKEVETKQVGNIQAKKQRTFEAGMGAGTQSSATVTQKKRDKRKIRGASAGKQPQIKKRRAGGVDDELKQQQSDNDDTNVVGMRDKRKDHDTSSADMQEQSNKRQKTPVDRSFDVKSIDLSGGYELAMKGDIISFNNGMEELFQAVGSWKNLSEVHVDDIEYVLDLCTLLRAKERNIMNTWFSQQKNRYKFRKDFKFFKEACFINLSNFELEMKELHRLVLSPSLPLSSDESRRLVALLTELGMARHQARKRSGQPSSSSSSLCLGSHGGQATTSSSSSSVGKEVAGEELVLLLSSASLTGEKEEEKEEEELASLLSGASLGEEEELASLFSSTSLIDKS